MYALIIGISVVFGFMCAWLVRGSVDRRADGSNGGTGSAGRHSDSAASSAVGDAEQTTERVTKANREVGEVVEEMAKLLDNVRRGSGVRGNDNVDNGKEKKVD